MTQPTMPDAPPGLAGVSAPPPVAGTGASPGIGAAGAPLGVPPALDAELGPPACANCGAALVGPYCARCGQKAAHRIVSLRHILEDTLEDQLSLNAALPRTFGALLLHPGRLTREYIAGRVVSYIPPMRLYLAASVLFFLVMVALPNGAQFRVQSSIRGGPGDAAPAAGAATSAGPLMLRIDTTGASGRTGRWVKRLGQQIARVSAQGRDVSRLLTEKFAETAPKVLFVMVPVFALLLKLLYVRRHRLYVEHFVFALHMHALAFIAFIPLLIFRSAVSDRLANNLASALVLGGIGVALLVAMRVVYAQGWGRTALKWLLLGFSYLIVVSVGLLTVVTIALFEV